MTGVPIGPPVGQGIEYTIIKDGNSWNICAVDPIGPADPDPDNSTEPACDGLEGEKTADGQVVGSGSKSPYKWSSTEVSIGTKSTISGFKVEARYYKEYANTSAPDNPAPTTYFREYEDFEIVSQELNYDGECPFTDSKSDLLFEESPGNVSVATAGISDEAAYSYPRVFDESDIKYFPRLSTPQQEPVTNGILPVEPHYPDADPPVYPIDAILSFLPDERPSVTVSYTLKTTYKAGGGEQTDEISITQEVTQPMGPDNNPFEDYDKKLRAVQELSYYYHKLPHMGLYPPPGSDKLRSFNLPVYDDDGNLTGDLNEPVTMVQLTRHSYPWDFENEEYPPYPEQACM